MHYLPFLQGLHERLAPETYLEIGLRNGASLALSRCRSVGVDPAYSLTAQLDGDFSVLRTTSDDFFAQPDPLRVTGGRPFDLTFIDGLHLFEYSLRDFIHAERYSRRGGAIVFDDVLPRSVDEAARERHTNFWTGDVYKMRAVLNRYRPDLVVITVDTIPTGLALVLGLDPENTVLADRYDEILAEFRTPDPQDVPEAVLRRDGVLDARRVLDTADWSAVRTARESGTPLDPQVRAELESIGAGDAGERPEPAGDPAADLSAALGAQVFSATRAGVVEDVRGALLTLPLDELRLPAATVVPCGLLVGELTVPARVTATSSGTLVQAWVSGLPGDYPLHVQVGDTRHDTRLLLRVGAAGELSVVDTPPAPEPVAQPAPAGSPLRAVARRVPGLRPAVVAYRRRAARRG